MRIEYNPEVSLGSLIQVGTIISTVFAAYLALSVKDAQHDAKLLQHDSEISRIDTNTKQMQADIKADIKSLSVDVKALDHAVTAAIIESQNANKRSK